MASTLEQLKQYTTVVADTGDIKCEFKDLFGTCKVVMMADSSDRSVQAH